MPGDKHELLKYSWYSYGWYSSVPPNDSKEQLQVFHPKVASLKGTGYVKL